MEERLFCFKAMGSIDEVHLFAPHHAETHAACNDLVDCICDLEKKYSRFIPDTIVSRINSAAGKERIPLDPETTALLSYADTCFKESGGLFDITSGVLRSIWDFKSCQVPSDSEIQRSKKLIGWPRVSIDDDGIFLPREGMEIDLGGVVKEYAADRAASILKEYGITNALINLGGDIHVCGPRPDGRPWNIGITHPRNTGASLASIALSQGALATSGDYERYFEKDGKRFCHIMNPKTGKPVSDLQAVTVCAESCLIAGSLSTITMLLGKTRGTELLNEAGISYLLVDKDGLITSRGPFQLHAGN